MKRPLNLAPEGRSIVHDPTIDLSAVRRAIELSATKYCSVGGTLATGITEIHHGYVVRDPAGREHSNEVIVTGPGERPDSLGSRPGFVAAAAG